MRSLWASNIYRNQCLLLSFWCYFCILTFGLVNFNLKLSLLYHFISTIGRLLQFGFIKAGYNVVQNFANAVIMSIGGYDYESYQKRRIMKHIVNERIIYINIQWEMLSVSFRKVQDLRYLSVSLECYWQLLV